MAFIAQIDLASLKAFPVARVLPPSGWLSFFYNPEQDTWGFDPKDAGSFRVLYTPPGPVPRIAPPVDLPDHGRFQTCTLTLTPDITLPPTESPIYQAAGLTSLPPDAMEALRGRLTTDSHWAERTMLFGYPDEIQGDMQDECALVTGGLYCGDTSGYQDPRAVTLRRSAPDWGLLLQVGSHDAASMMWGDMGCLYYWIRQGDLAAQAFERAWLILQCS